MIHSMTGFGKSDLEYGQKKITIEIRTLNSKQLDINIKLPAVLKDRESEIRNELSKELIRGKVDVFISFDGMEEEKGIAINASIFKDYYQQVKKICEELNIEMSNDIVSSILRLPDTMKMEKPVVEEEEWQTIHNGIVKALQEVKKFRVQEGACLNKDLLERLTEIETLRDALEPFEAERIEKIKNRIKNNLEELIGWEKMDKNRFEQELLYFIEKLDINEEKVRLKNHCTYFRETIEGEEYPGRKLGFIAQEIGREINTIGSKANDSTIQKMVVKMKDELEKIKEQINNVL